MKRRQPRRTRPSDVAARRYGDGIPANHADRAVDITDVFPVVRIKAETAQRKARNLFRKLAQRRIGPS